MKKNKQGFTLIELLTVIAIIGILAGIIIPSVGAVRTSAKKAKVQSMYSQWASAIELFRQDYGYYPSFGASNNTPVNVSSNSTEFIALLEGSDTAGMNSKGIRYYSFPDDAFEDPDADNPTISDAFGNTEIYMVVDSDRDGEVTALGETVRSSVVFYSDAVDDIDAPEIRSWN